MSDGLDCLLFNIVVLGFCQTKNGKIWRRNPGDLCIIENTKKTYKVILKSLCIRDCYIFKNWLLDFPANLVLVSSKE